MQAFIDEILEKVPYDAINQTELNFLIQGTSAAKYNQLKRAVNKNNLIRLRRGLYLLHERYRRHGLNYFYLAQRIHGPSAISLESALSYHALIPEAVYTITSVTTTRSKCFQTPLGDFSYLHVPAQSFSVGLHRVNEGGQVFLIASPLKALADYVYSHRTNWRGLDALVGSLRIELSELKSRKKEQKAIEKAYDNPIVSEFIEEYSKR